MAIAPTAMVGSTYRLEIGLVAAAEAEGSNDDDGARSARRNKSNTGCSVQRSWTVIVWADLGTSAMIWWCGVTSVEFVLRFSTKTPGKM